MLPHTHTYTHARVRRVRGGGPGLGDVLLRIPFRSRFGRRSAGRLKLRKWLRRLRPDLRGTGASFSWAGFLGSETTTALTRARRLDSKLVSNPPHELTKKFLFLPTRRTPSIACVRFWLAATCLTHPCPHHQYGSSQLIDPTCYFQHLYIFLT
jgi:hypothetical protein